MDPGTGERYVPHVIEPSAGADRGTLAFMVDAYDEEEVEGRERVVLRLHPRLAPVKVAVLPLVNKDGQPEKAREIYEDLRTRMPAEFDTGGSIGKRYRRQDEIGTPWGVTVDHQTMEDDTVTLRDRDSLEQTRIADRRAGRRARAAPGRALDEPEARSWLISGSHLSGPMQPLFEHRLELAGYGTRALELEGDGPPLLLLHGYSDSADTWRLLLDRLGRVGRRAVALDMPGFGTADVLTTTSRSCPSSTRFAAAAVEWMRARGRRGGGAATRSAAACRCCWPSATTRPGRHRAGGARGPRHGALVRGDRARPAAAPLLASPVPIPRVALQRVVARSTGGWPSTARATSTRCVAADVRVATSRDRATTAPAACATGRRLLPELRDRFRPRADRLPGAAGLGPPGRDGVPDRRRARAGRGRASSRLGDDRGLRPLPAARAPRPARRAAPRLPGRSLARLPTAS